ncbi:MAG TPA: N-acetylmuramoyl-L-alanine amidase-like domain-containing protein [Prolixibacteraceae bacterium]|nr:N-acetylmuramoyl-L-alanine amidase-like domain-containing protein [Prolixibacteraceae bacterium]
MKKRIGPILLILSLFLNNSQAQSVRNDRIYQPADKQIAEDKLILFSADAGLPIADLVAGIGLSFLGTPYVAATLENGLEEKLVINLRELDCTTFAENCLALARTIKLGKIDFESFAAQLELIRYRDGIRNQYPSRLHYFSEWIHNNSEKKIISETPNFQGEKLLKTIALMSTKPESYPVLKAYPELIPLIAEQEKQLSSRAFYYFPKKNPENLLKTLHHGDIIGLTSGIDGIDVNHVGIIIRKDNQFHLLHASLSAGKVVLSEGPVTDFIKPESKNSGIMIARPVF